ncbi:MAG: N-formylglutamate amidohydrolase [Rhizobiaceae bacterium]
MTADFTYQNPFIQRLPEEQSSPFVVNSPHSGRCYPDSFLKTSRLNSHAIRRSEDFLVDELVENACDHGMPVLNAVYPRAFLDVNREPFELDPSMFDGELPDQANTKSIRVSSGLGTIARIVSEGEEIYATRLPASEALKRISGIYRPYHAALQNLLARTHVKFGMAILLDFHSMPSSGGTPTQENRADIVLGNRYGSSCDPKIIHHVKNALGNMGYQVEVNRPYAGGFITEHYGRPFNGLHALQIEINRSLYMDEVRIARGKHFEKIVTDFNQFFAGLNELNLSGLEGAQPLAAE